MNDQAQALRERIQQSKRQKGGYPASERQNKDIYIYSVLSGKGGVGKTNISVNVALAMVKLGKRVLILDGDIGMTNVDIIMGAQSKYDIFDYFEGKASIDEILCDGPGGIKLLSGGSGLLKLDTLNEYKQNEFLNELLETVDFDVMIIDNGAGISRETLTFTSFAHEAILVTTPEPTAITDAYRVLKAISFYELKSRVQIIVNRVDNEEEGNAAFTKLKNTADAFLEVDVQPLGFVTDDNKLEKAVMEQVPVNLSYPKSTAAREIEAIAKRLVDPEAGANSKVSTIDQFKRRFIKLFGS